MMDLIHFMQDNTREIGICLSLFIAIYFLFRIGIRLVDDDLGDFKWLAWSALVLGVILGWICLHDRNPLGYLGFLPALTYIFLKMLKGIKFNRITNSNYTNTRKKIITIIFSGIASSITYIVTHSFFNFGIPEASISAVIAAAVLGLIGYNA